MKVEQARKVYALIFARGGSKGLPGKNIKPLNGKPLLAYSVDLALSLPNIYNVYVSTDDHNIANVARNCGAIVVQRPAELASDTASEWSAWKHAVHHLKHYHNMDDDDLFLSLPCTSPLRTTADILSLLAVFDEQNPDLALCVTESSRNPFFNMVKFDEVNSLQLVCDAGQFVRRQDAPKTYDITTVGYVTTAKFIESANSVLSGKTAGAIVEREHSVDIDDAFDFELASFLLNQREKKHENV